MTGVVRRGRGQPVTVIAPGGVTGERRAEAIQVYAQGVAGTRVSFDYQKSGHFEPLSKMRREAERDAVEVLALAREHDATRAIGISRGARAVVGVLADEPTRFERVVLFLAPGGTAAGRYFAWLESLEGAGHGGVSADILVIGWRGDPGHPARIGEQWASRLGAQLEILPSRDLPTETERLQRLVADFLNR